MKNLITLSFVLLLAHSGYSQISDNTFYLGGGIGYTSQTSNITFRNVKDFQEIKEPSASQLRFTSGLGYFLSEKISLNFDFGYSTISAIQNSSINGDYIKATENIFSLNPYMRYLIMLEENKFGFIFNTGIIYATSQIKYEEKNGIDITKTEDPKSTFLNIGITPGIIYFPNEKIGLEATFGFIGYYRDLEKEIINADQDIETVTSGFTIGANSLNPALNFGFRYYFQR